MRPIHCAGTVLVLLALALGACSSGPDDAAGNQAQSEWLAVARGRVDVEGGLVQVAARTDGVVDAVAVKQGDAVEAGQPLARLDSRSATIAVQMAQAGVQQAKAELEGLDVSLKQAEHTAPRVAAAARAGAATGEAAEQSREAVASLKARRSAAQAALDGAQQKLAAAQLELELTTVSAPVAGTVISRRVAIGQTVSAASGQPLFELLPDRPHVVRAQVDADAAGSIRPGMRAEVVLDSGTGPVYAATVLWVGQVLEPASLTRDPLQRAIANDVDCTLELAPEKSGVPPLRIGQRVLVRFPRAQKAQRGRRQLNPG